MHASLSTMAQLTLNASFDATNIMEFRRQLKEVKDKLGLANVTINDIILYAVSRTILNYKDCNANFIEDGTVMRYFKNVHLGIAVDTPRGLMVPTLRDANLKSLNQISVEAKALATAAQSGTINPDDLKGGTFTVTNLGTMGIESFTPVINPPQTCILGQHPADPREERRRRAEELSGNDAFPHLRPQSAGRRPRGPLPAGTLQESGKLHDAADQISTRTYAYK